MAIAPPARVLIVQDKFGAVDSADAELSLDNFLAQEFDDSGKTKAIVWSITDPIFRTAKQDGLLQGLPVTPNLEQAKIGARALRADYLIWCSAVRKGDKIQGKIEVFKDGRSVLKDSQGFGVATRGELDAIATVKSIGRSWFIKISSNLWKEAPIAAKVEAPEPVKGQAPEVVTPVAAPTNANGALRTQFEELVKTDKSKALIFIKDAVDAQPLDADRRVMLILFLMKEDPIAAVIEARRATKLIPEDVQLRNLAAQSSIQAGKPEEARDELLEAVARQPEDVALRISLAVVFLRSGEPAKAIELCDRAVKLQNNPEILFRRALCRALLGGIDGMKSDLDAAEAQMPNPVPQVVEARCALSQAVYLLVVQSDLESTRNLIQLVAIRPKDELIRERLQSMQRVVASRGAFLERLNPPANLRGFFTGLNLAHKLHQQCLLDLQDFTAKESDDLLTEARLNFGESLRTFGLLKAK